MGNTLKTKLLILSGIFLITSFFIYSVKGPVLHNKPSLKQHFQTIENYRTIQHIPLSGENLKMLKLDDYLYADFKGPDGIVNLYIGYYYTSNKAYASHSPLVCYPSHGWEITRHPTKHSTDVGPHSIHYNEIITSMGNNNRLVLYWLQAHNQTNTNAVKNKIAMGYNKFMYGSEQHAFVRISVSIVDSNYLEAKNNAINFLETFYPQFIDYIDEEPVL